MERKHEKNNSIERSKSLRIILWALVIAEKTDEVIDIIEKISFMFINTISIVAGRKFLSFKRDKDDLCLLRVHVLKQKYNLNNTGCLFSQPRSQHALQSRVVGAVHV